MAEYQSTTEISSYVSYPSRRPYCSIRWTLTAYFGLSSVLGAGDSGPRFEAFHGEMGVRAQNFTEWELGFREVK